MNFVFQALINKKKKYIYKLRTGLTVDRIFYAL